MNLMERQSNNKRAENEKVGRDKKKEGVEGHVRPTSGTALVAGAMGDVSW